MTIAAFDFDGTITTKDTLFDFLQFSFGTNRLLKALLNLFPILFLHKIGIKSNHEAKQKLFSHFFKDMPVETYYDLCNKYADRIENILSVDAINKLNEHKRKGDTVIIVSASIQDWIIPWAKRNGLDIVLATEVEVVANKVTGTFKTKNCYGKEKVERLLAIFPDKKLYSLYAYGDSAGDKHLLEFADFPFYRTF
jgi:phosphatidylglycerophosphatase C